MTTDLLDPSAAPAPEATTLAPTSARPDSVPEKFWDAERGALRTEALLQSHAELEQMLGFMVRVPGEGASAEEIASFRRALGVPETPDAYALTVAEELGGADPEINERLHAAGFTPAQAQLVYDLAADYLLPLLDGAAAEFEAERQTERLVREFGGEARWREISGQLRAWGRANLKPEALRALSSTYEGVMALRRMMDSGEPGPLGAGAAAAPQDEAAIRTLMRDPRYWRDRDPGLVAQVTAGFRRLYGGEG